MGSQVEEFQQSVSYREFFGIDGEPIEFGWNIFPRLTSLEFDEKTQKDLQKQHIEPANFEVEVKSNGMETKVILLKKKWQATAGQMVD